MSNFLGDNDSMHVGIYMLKVLMKKTVCAIEVRNREGC